MSDVVGQDGVSTGGAGSVLVLVLFVGVVGAVVVGVTEADGSTDRVQPGVLDLLAVRNDDGAVEVVGGTRVVDRVGVATGADVEDGGIDGAGGIDGRLDRAVGAEGAEGVARCDDDAAVGTETETDGGVRGPERVAVGAGKSIVVVVADSAKATDAGG